MKVRAKKNFHLQDICYSMPFGCSGCSILCDVTTSQIFNVSKKGKYYFLTRKHLGFSIRLTEMALTANFEEVREE